MLVVVVKSAYMKRCKIFFGYNKYYSVTAMLHELDFSDFNTVVGSHQHALHRQILLCDNDVVKDFFTPAFAVIELS